ncbi:hypothetical protein [Ancylobacter defluvii]|uniref:Uncharacterized protein n=1 Tax=Ancylobacter defluvii TaxID=1282440 RepID=A0A9W6NB83_9HYPH|nr:hypothetical protein [Ancylobacter defluvii]MBS7586054.1 hypothetical protein [Ancylobacter defluvii]GLK84433.1 hypothetical protein GCM10017653_25030 [Ancylobacter defluvii]
MNIVEKPDMEATARRAVLAARLAELALSEFMDNQEPGTLSVLHYAIENCIEAAGRALEEAMAVPLAPSRQPC